MGEERQFRRHYRHNSVPVGTPCPFYLYEYDDVIVVLIYKRVDSDEGVLIRCGHFITVQYTGHTYSMKK